VTEPDRAQLTVTLRMPWFCTCCGAVTRFRLRGMPLCAYCGCSAIEARARQLRRDPATAAVPWPVEPLFCNKRGHKAAHLARRPT
jgi:hypothetical protein